MPDTSAEALLSNMLSEIESLPLDDVTEGTLADLGTRYDLTLRVAAALKVWASALEQSLIDTMPEDTLSMDGVLVKREEASRSAWKDRHSSKRMQEDIAHTIATSLATDVATGDVDPMRRNLMANAIRTVLKDVLPAPSTMKVKAKDYGLYIGEYRNFSTTYKITRITHDDIAEEGTTGE